jgi:transcriptional regulator EpsA
VAPREGSGEDMDVMQQADELDVDLTGLLNIIARAARIRESRALLELINSDVAATLQHEAMVCGWGTSDADGSYVHNVLHHNYPPGYFDALATPEGKADSPLIRQWRATMQPVAFQAGRDDDKFPIEWVNIFKQHGLRNTVAHGVLDMRRTFSSYFIFSNIAGEVGEKEIFLLKILVPNLHFALMRSLTTVMEYRRLAGSSQQPLTEQQKAILQWVHQGKTNWEIAQILSVNENNVKYNIGQILAKLEVRNRAQAVSKAILLGLLNS